MLLVHAGRMSYRDMLELEQVDAATQLPPQRTSTVWKGPKLRRSL